MEVHNNLIKMTSAVVLAIAIGAALTACNDDDVADAVGDGSPALLASDDSGSTATELSALNAAPETPENGSISSAEEAGLLFMREEEKLARDVYLTLYDTWNQQVFQNISRSEQAHTDAVLALLEQYGISDPVGDNPVGVFVDEALQALHDKLVNQGSASLIDALLVGAAIEEIDIIDIEKRKEDVIGNDDIIEVYDNILLKGSRNHLRAFVKNLETQGITYQPQYLSQAEYDAIISGETERGTP